MEDTAVQLAPFYFFMSFAQLIAEPFGLVLAYPVFWFDKIEIQYIETIGSFGLFLKIVAVL